MRFCFSSKCKTTRHDKLAFESLENRQLLAFSAPFSYMWTEDITSSEPVESYLLADSDTGGTITSERIAKGHFAVNFRGLNSSSTGKVVAHATAYGNDATHCKPDRMSAGDHENDLQVQVRCFDSVGHPVDSRFNVAVIDRFSEAGIWFVEADRPNTSEYTPATRHAPADSVSVRRLREGQYVAYFDRMTLVDIGANVQVTALGDNPNRCVIDRWNSTGGFSANVSCVNPGGDKTDTPFSLSVFAQSSHADNLGFGWTKVDTASEPELDPLFSYNPSEYGISKQHIDTGKYQVLFAGMNYVGDRGGHVQVTAYGDADKHCKIVNWDTPNTDMAIRVSCYDSSGNPADSRFSILATPPLDTWHDDFEPNQNADDAKLLLGDARVTGSIHSPEDVDYFKWMNVTEAGEIELDMVFNAGGDDLRFEVDGPNGFNEVSEMRAEGFHRLTFDSQLGDVFTIRVLGTGQLSNRSYSLSTRTPGSIESRTRDLSVSYARVALSTSSEPIVSRPNNQSGGDVRAERSGIGQWEVTFEGLAPILDRGGNVQVNSPSISDYCKVVNWRSEIGGDDFSTRIHCFDRDGEPVDGPMFVAVIPPANEHNFAFAWAGRKTGTYETLPKFTYNPSGTVEVDRTNVGRYTVRFEGLGSDRPGGNVQVTSYGPDNTRCKVREWRSLGEDFSVEVQCMSSTGEVKDSLFSIAIIPAGTTSSLGYAWSHHPAGNEWPVPKSFSHNPAGGSIVKTHRGTGSYQMEFLESASLGFYGGGSLVTAYGTSDAFCNSSSSLYASVNCRNTEGTREDSGFSLVVLPPTLPEADPDANADNTVDLTDIGMFCSALNHFPSPVFDFNEDARVDGFDLNHLVHDALRTTYGDANLDGVFDSSDLIKVFVAGEYEDEIPGNSTWDEGDWNCDGNFNTLDLVYAFQDGGYVSTAERMIETAVQNRRATSVELADLAFASLVERDLDED